jgi:hypothetical protein
MKGESRMNSPESDARSERQEQERPAVRRPYVKPEFLYESVFETVALTCAPKHNGNS